jgi:hypothetical protein
MSIPCFALSRGDGRIGQGRLLELGGTRGSAAWSDGTWGRGVGNLAHAVCLLVKGFLLSCSAMSPFYETDMHVHLSLMLLVLILLFARSSI